MNIEMNSPKGKGLQQSFNTNVTIHRLGRGRQLIQDLTPHEIRQFIYVLGEWEKQHLIYEDIRWDGANSQLELTNKRGE